MEDGEAALHKADVVIAEVERLPLLGAELAVLCDQCKIKDEFRAFLAKFNVQTVAQFASITDDENNLKTDVFDVCEVELNFGDRTNLRWAWNLARASTATPVGESSKGKR